MRSRCLLLLILLSSVEAAEWFVAPGGDDSGEGNPVHPFATIQRAQQAASPGDTVFIAPGTYRMSEEMIATNDRIWAHVIHLDKSGSEGKPIRYTSLPGERPVFDFSEVRPEGKRVNAFHVSGSYIELVGIEVTGVQVTIAGHTQSICFSNVGNHNRYERLAMHDGMGIGFYLSKGSDNLVLNCDAWNNHDPVSGNRRGGNVDGFGCHPNRRGTGNVFRGCRAWFNSDDGFDCISAWESIRFENCWAFQNGMSPDGESLGDGNGFKIGGFGLVAEYGLPKPIPRHVVTHCVAAKNKASGFYANHHPGGIDWFHNSAFGNRRNFNFLCRDLEEGRDLPGFDHVIVNNLSFGGQSELENVDEDACRMEGNLFGEKLTKRDFLSLDLDGLVEARAEDGSLPEIPFMRPAPRRRIIDRGVELEEEFDGRAPEPGAHEFDPNISVRR